MAAIKRTVKENGSQGAERIIACSRCAARTHHIVLLSLDIGESDEYSASEEHFMIVQCQGCKTTSFLHTWREEDDFIQVGEDEWEPYEHIEVYPKRLEGRRELDGVEILPSKIRLIYQETNRALNEDLPVVAGIGIRAIVESGCSDLNAKGSDLKQQIDDLAGRGLLSAASTEVLHHLRVMGNKAAHEVEPHGRTQLGLGMRAVDNLLEGAYVIPARATKAFGTPP